MRAARRKEGHEGWGKGENQRADDGGWERVKQGGRETESSSIALHTPLAKQENPTLDESQEAAQVGNLNCGISPAFPAALISILCTYIHIYMSDVI